MFVSVEWENTPKDKAMAMIEQIESKGIAIIRADMGEMVCYSDHENFEPLKDILTNVVHDHNDGMWCEVKEVSEQSIEHPL